MREVFTSRAGVTLSPRRGCRRYRASTLIVAALIAFAHGPASRAQALQGEHARVAPSSLSDASSRELAKLLAGPESWTAVTLSRHVLPRIPADVLDRTLMWSEIALDTTAVDHTPLTANDPRPAFAQQFGPARSARAMAIVHIALFEAVNAVARRFESYARVAPAGDAALSLDRAVAEAAYETLVALYPAQRQRLDALLAQDIAHMPGSLARLEAGRALGARAAGAILALRANDGSQLPEPQVGDGPGDFHVNPAPGYWSPDPVSQLTVALGANWSRVAPFVMSSASQFRPPPPPGLASHAYAVAYNRTLVLGGDPVRFPTQRTPEQTFISRFWAYDGTPALCAPPRLYNMVARTVALSQGMTNVAELARFLALANTAMADAAIAAWDAKWHYQHWRPVTGIRGGASANNPETVGYPGWYPLGAPATNTAGPNFTPPFPAYPSGHATLGGALFEVFRAYWPDNTRFTLVSDEYNGLNRDADGTIRPLVPQTFQSFTEAEYDNAESRIYNGVHWEYDAVAGVALGHEVARLVIRDAFRRRDD